MRLYITFKIIIFILSTFLLNGSQNVLVSQEDNYLDVVTSIKPIQDIIMGYYKSWDLIYILPTNLNSTKTGINSLAYSPDGTELVTSSCGKISFWNALTFEFTRALYAHKYRAEIEFSPDGEQLITSNDNSTKIWNSKTVDMIRTINQAGSCATFSVTKQLAICENNAISFKNRDNTPSTRNAHVLLVPETQARIYFITYSPNGAYLAALVKYPKKSELILWDSEHYRQIYTKQIVAGTRQAISFSPDSERIALATPDILVVYSIKIKQEIYSGEHKNICSVRYTPNNLYIIIGFTELKIEVLGAQKFTPQQTLSGPSSFLTIAPDSNHLATCALSDDVIYIWQAPLEFILTKLSQKKSGTVLSS